MSSNTTAAVAVTVLFAVVAPYSLVRSVVSTSWIDRVSNVVHTAMGIVMGSMPWAWYAVFPVAAQIVFFTAAAFWYVYLALFRPHAEAAPGVGHRHRPGVLWYHALMMTAMVWMAVAMSPLSAGTHMGGMHMSPDDRRGSAPEMLGTLPWAVVVSILLGAVFAIAAAWFLVLTARQAVLADRFAGAEARDLGDLFMTAVMAAGMATAFLALMT